MNGNFLCAYCTETDPDSFNEEHVVPRAFGKFFDDDGIEVVITGRVCESCNNSFSIFEQRHARESPEAFNRAHAKVKGRRPKKSKPNPYLQKEDGSRPIIVKGRRDGREIYMRMDPVEGLVELTSAQFIHPKSGDLTAVDLKKDMTREDVLRELKNAGHEKPVELAIYCREHEKPWVAELFAPEGTKFGTPPPPPNDEGLHRRWATQRRLSQHC